MRPAIAYDRAGSGPPLVLLHPLGADRHVWDLVIPELTPTRDVIALDLPGFGASPSLADTTPTPAALAQAVADGLRGLGIPAGGADIAGNSLGGWVALELGLTGHARSVTAIAPAGLWPRPLRPKPLIARTLARAGRPVIGAAVRTAAGRRLLLTGAAAHPERVPPRTAAHLIRSYATAPDFVRVNTAMRGGVFTQLDEIDVPVTLVWPEHDGLIARPTRLPPQIRNVALADAAHIPMLDGPDAVAALLLEAATAPHQSDARRAAR